MKPLSTRPFGVADEADAPDAWAQERAAQAALVQALFNHAAPAPAGWCGPPGPLPAHQQSSAERALQGLGAYRHNRSAHAAQALALAYPVLAQLLSEETLAALAGRYWLAHPPEGGDLGEWGGSLADWLEAQPGLTELPWLGDMARLEWAVHQAQRSPVPPAQAGARVPGLALLASADPARLQLSLAPGLAGLASAWPVVAIWQAHQPQSLAPEGAGWGSEPAEDAETLAQRLAAVAPGPGAALVWRQGWRAAVQPAAGPQVQFTQALLQGHSLGRALQAHPDTNFEQWLIQALQAGWLLALQLSPDT